LNALAKEFDGRLRILGVSANGDEDSNLAREAKDLGIAYPVARATDQFAVHYFGSRSTLTLPATFVFDATGRLRRAFRRTITGRDIKRALDTGRTAGQDHLEQAMVEAAAKKFGRVRIHLAKAVKLEPESPVSWWRLGRLEAQEKHWPGAVAALERSLSLAPDSMKTMTDLGHAYLMVDKNDQAIRLFQTVADRENSAVALLNLAKAFGKAGEMKKASETIEFAREKDPELLKALQERMKAQAKQMGADEQKNTLQPDPQAPWPTQLQPQGP
jgi:tetratricopeptide (TPR) repeat protein